jgi:hypothetical protein
MFSGKVRYQHIKQLPEKVNRKKIWRRGSLLREQKIAVSNPACFYGLVDCNAHICCYLITFLEVKYLNMENIF